MSGTKAGGHAAYQTNISKYGRDFYAKIGSKGGKLGKTGGFAAKKDCTNQYCAYRNLLGRREEHYVAQCAGVKGGSRSRRPSLKGRA